MVDYHLSDPYPLACMAWLNPGTCILCKCHIKDTPSSQNFATKFHDKVCKVKLFATQALSQTQKNISEPQTGIEPATFWSPVRRSNHWATRTRMASCKSSSYICMPSTSLIICQIYSNMILYTFKVAPVHWVFLKSMPMIFDITYIEWMHPGVNKPASMALMEVIGIRKPLHHGKVIVNGRGTYKKKKKALMFLK